MKSPAQPTPQPVQTPTPEHQRSWVVEHSPVYYGWVILAAATFGLMMTTPGQTVGVSVFLDKIIAELGLQRTTVSLLYTVGTLIGSFSLPFVGRFIDWRGPRLAVVLIASLFALACVWMGFVNGLVTLLVGFILIRGLGQGALGLVSLYVVNIWFVRRRGLAVGLSGLGIALGSSFFPPLIEVLLGAFGWRTAYMLLGRLVAVTILPLGAWLFRAHPERFGLQPDGAALPQADLTLNEVNYTLGEAQRTLTFWVFAGGAVCVAAFGTGLLFHHYDIMMARGVTREVAATMFVTFGLVMAGTNFVTGVLVDRVPPRFLLSAMLALLCTSLWFAPQVDGPTLMLAYGTLFGLTQGMQGAIQGSVYAHYFGREYIGSIKGFVSTLSVAGTAFGPFLFAVGLDTFGGYAPILLLCATLPLAVAITALFVKPPRADAPHNSLA